MESQLASIKQAYLLPKKPVIVTDYPKDIKPFYMRVNDDDRTVRSSKQRCMMRLN